MNFLKKIFSKKQKVMTTTLTVSSENGFHLRPIAKFVNEVKQFLNTNIYIVAKKQKVSATQVPKILSLSLEQNDSFILECEGIEAVEASAYLSDFFIQMMKDDVVIEEVIQVKESYEALSIQGKTISKGIAISKLTEYETSEITQVNESNNSLKDAIKLTKEELYNLYQSNKSKHEAQIFLAQQELLSSDMFRYGCSTTKRFLEIIREEIKKLENTKFSSRISDYQDLQQRVLQHLGLSSIIKVPNEPYILFADDLLPSEIMKLQDTPIQGAILKKGTATSHASILLRSFGIPSMIINKDIKPSNRAILDASSGNLIHHPTPSDLTKAKTKQKAFQKEQEESYEKRFELSKTKNDKEIKVLANVSDLHSVNEAKEQGADGIGLLRTEFLFTQKKPSLEEQIQSYKEIFKCFNHLTIRTLDIGGDKELPYINIEKEDNPFLGIRGIRFSLREQKLFSEQLLAIYKAIQAVMPSPKIIKIMFPMISTVEEFNQAKQIAVNIAKQYNINLSNIQFGIMIEVPSVIFSLPQFNKVVDFYSIGTNDLTQYIFAVERTHPSLVVDAISPIIMKVLQNIIEQVDKPISICGELAGLEEVTKELIEMGYDTLSVSAKLIPSLKERIRHV